VLKGLGIQDLKGTIISVLAARGETGASSDILSLKELAKGVLVTTGARFQKRGKNNVRRLSLVADGRVEVVLSKSRKRANAHVEEGDGEVSPAARGGRLKHLCRKLFSVFVSFAWLRWCEYGAPARLADSSSWISCFATTRWSVITLDPGKTDEQLLLLLVDTTIEGASPSHARQE
jgi:hypothetical protein